MTSSSPPRAAHPYYMHDAIYAQPGALRLVERGNEAALSAAATALRGVNRVWLAGVGSSWHAALVGERSEEHTSELQSHHDLVCRLLLEKKKKKYKHDTTHHDLRRRSN